MSQFVGGPVDGETREVYGDPQTVILHQMTAVSWGPDGPRGEVIEHAYEKRAGGFYYEHVGALQVWPLAE